MCNYRDNTKRVFSFLKNFCVIFMQWFITLNHFLTFLSRNFYALYGWRLGQIWVSNTHIATKTSKFLRQLWQSFLFKQVGQLLKSGCLIQNCFVGHRKGNPLLRLSPFYTEAWGIHQQCDREMTTSDTLKCLLMMGKAGSASSVSR